MLAVTRNRAASTQKMQLRKVQLDRHGTGDTASVDKVNAEEMQDQASKDIIRECPIKKPNRVSNLVLV